MALESTAKQKTQHIETYLEMLKVSIGQFSKSVVLENLLKALSENSLDSKEALSIAMKRLANTMEANPEIYEFLLLDKNGKVVASTNEKNIGLDKSTDAFFIGGQKNIYIKDAYFSDQLKERLIAVSAPFFNSTTGEFLGVIAARVKIKELDRIMTDLPNTLATLEMYIVNKYGYMITPSRFSKNTFLKQKINTINFRSCLDDRQNNIHMSGKHVSIAPNYQGARVLGVHEYIPEMQWCILVEVNTKEAFAPLAKIRALFVTILFTIPFTAWLLGMFLSRLITGPIHKLHKGTEIIGEGNLDYKVGTNAKDEIGQLSRAFDAMTVNLKHTTTSIEALNKEINERKMLEKKLANTAQEWEATFNSITDLISIQNKDLKLIRVNKAYADFFKRKPEDLVGKSCCSIVHGTNEPPIICSHEKTIELGKSHMFEYFEPRFGLYFEVSISPIFNDKKEVVGTVHTIKNITERKKIEKDLREATEAKSYFTSMVSHELRTPLTAIKEGISIVLDGSTGTLNNDQKEFLEISKRNVDRLARLINDVLDYQKLESGKFEFNFQENDINEIINEVHKTMLQVAKNKNLDIVLDLASDLPRIKLDRDKIIQVFVNLLNNAIKFTEKGYIAIVSVKKENIVQLTVKDTGPGVRQEDLSKLFLAFEQLEKGKDRKTGGTGLGLAISKQIIEKHKGKIWAESEFGKGLTFHIVLPIIERRV